MGNLDKNVAIEVSNIAQKRNWEIKQLEDSTQTYNTYVNLINNKVYNLWSYIWRTGFLLISIYIFCKYIEYINRGDIEEIILLMLSQIFLALSLCIVFIAIPKEYKYRKNLKKAKNEIKFMKSIISDRQKDVNFYSRQLESYDLLAPEYWYVADKIMHYIIVGRADTVKEALNLFENEQRMDRQFKMQMQKLHEINRNLVKNGTINAAGFATLGVIGTIGILKK